MTELDTDTLRRALRPHAGDVGTADDPLDVSAIISQGRGLRRRRRVTAVAGGICAAAAVFGIATGITHLIAQPARSDQPALSPGPAQHHVLSGRTAPARPVTGMPTPVASATPSATGATGGPTPTPTSTSTPTPTSTSTASTSPTSSTTPSPSATDKPPTASPTALPSLSTSTAQPAARP
jgi:hypothetical protein